MADIEGKKTGGRIAGTPNKKNQEIQDLAKELGCNPAKILMLFAMGDHEALRAHEAIGNEQRLAAADKLMPYLYGKRKPIDSNGDDSRGAIDEVLEAINASRE